MKAPYANFLLLILFFLFSFQSRAIDRFPFNVNQYRFTDERQGENELTSEPALFFSTNFWTGTESTAWETSGNWSLGTVPDENSDVIIESDSVIVSSNVSCKSLTVKASANLTINPGGSMTVIGNNQSTALPNLSWAKLFGGIKADQASSILRTTDSGYLVAGSTDHTNSDFNGSNGNRNGFVMKLDAKGNKVWTTVYGGSNSDQLSFAIPAGDGGYILIGATNSIDGDLNAADFKGQIDTWVLKIDSNGNKLWSKMFGGTRNDIVTSIITATDGGYLLAGRSDSNDGDAVGNGGREDGWLLKLDSNGNKLWSILYGGAGVDQLWSISKVAGGGYVLAGFSSSNNGAVSGNHGGFDLWVMRINENGSGEWSNLYGGTLDDAATDETTIIQTADGGFLVTGYSNSNDGNVGESLGSSDAWVLKLNPNGSKMWSKVLGGTAGDAATSVLSTADGGFLVLIESQSSDGDINGNHGMQDAVVISLDSVGTKRWSKSFGGSGWEEMKQIMPTVDGGFVLVGSSSSNDGDVSGNQGYFDVLIMKIKN